MTLKEYNERLSDALRDVETSLGETMVKLGTEALTLIKRRVQETGTNAEGNKFRAYSTDKMYVGSKQMNASVAKSFFGKENNKKHDWVTLQRGGKNYRLAVLKGGYEEFRKMHGRRTDITDFTFYDKMWGSMHIISNKTEHNSGTVVIGPATDEEMNKLKGNVDKRGQILDLSDEEITGIANRFKLDTLRIMRNNGL